MILKLKEDIDNLPKYVYNDPGVEIQPYDENYDLPSYESMLVFMDMVLFEDSRTLYKYYQEITDQEEIAKLLLCIK